MPISSVKLPPTMTTITITTITVSSRSNKTAMKKNVQFIVVGQTHSIFNISTIQYTLNYDDS